MARQNSRQSQAAPAYKVMQLREDIAHMRKETEEMFGKLFHMMDTLDKLYIQMQTWDSESASNLAGFRVSGCAMDGDEQDLLGEETITAIFPNGMDGNTCPHGHGRKRADNLRPEKLTAVMVTTSTNEECVAGDFVQDRFGITNGERMETGNNDLGHDKGGVQRK